jgi:ferredoxin
MVKDKRIVLVSTATRTFLREALRLRSESDQEPEGRKYTLGDFLHGYVYGRWLYHYISIGTGEHPWAKKYCPRLKTTLKAWAGIKTSLGIPASQPDSNHPTGTTADTYHGKVVPLDAARQLVMVNEALTLPDLEHIIPYPRARDLILRNPDHIVVIDCPCRSARENPCLPLDVCLVVGEPFASFVVQHHPEKARWISSQEAVEILQAEDARGHVHHAFFKDAMLNRFYAICNCCSCCCGAMQAQRRGSPMLISSGYVAKVDQEICLGCGECKSTCQFEAIAVPNGTAQVDESACMGCGICVEHCPNQALSLQREASKGEPLEILELIASQRVE